MSKKKSLCFGLILFLLLAGVLFSYFLSQSLMGMKTELEQRDQSLLDLKHKHDLQLT